MAFIDQLYITNGNKKIITNATYQHIGFYLRAQEKLCAFRNMTTGSLQRGFRYKAGTRIVWQTFDAGIRMQLL